MKTLTFLKPAGPELTAQQPKIIMQILEVKFGANVAVRIEDLGRALADEPTFVSKQDPTLVVAYYCRRLSDLGFVKYEITPDAPAVSETPDEELVDIPPAPRDIFADETPAAKAPAKRKAGGKAKAAKGAKTTR